MKLRITIGSILALTAFPVCHAQTINFDRSQPGSVPDGWTIGMTHAGPAPKWEVLKDQSAPSPPNVFAQTSTDRTAGRFPLAIWDRASLKDGTLTVKFKAISGTVDQGAGLVWRYRDANNYYIVRANALEDNVRFYRVVKGQREQLEGANIKVTANEWHQLGLRAEGERFTITFDGKQLFTATDRTFTAAGKVALWTKADSVTRFDRIEIKTLP